MGAVLLRYYITLARGVVSAGDNVQFVQAERTFFVAERLYEIAKCETHSFDPHSAHNPILCHVSRTGESENICIAQGLGQAFAL